MTVEELLEQYASGERDFKSAYLEGAILAGTILSGAYLTGAILKDAILKDADLKDADLAWANLRRADLSGADLYGTNLEGADLRGADLRGANLSWANLKEANLTSANLTGAIVTWSNLKGTIHQESLDDQGKTTAVSESQKCDPPTEHTLTAVFELRGGKHIELPPPDGDGWKASTVNHDWPRLYMGDGDFVDHWAEQITHDAARMIWAEYETQLESEQAQILSITTWHRPVPADKPGEACTVHSALITYPLLNGVE